MTSKFPINTSLASIFEEPVTLKKCKYQSSLFTLFERRELKVWTVFPQLGIARCLLELTIRLCGVKLDLSFELHGLNDCLCSLLDADLVLLTNYKHSLDMYLMLGLESIHNLFL